MASFVETQFPTSISLGATGGAEFSTDIITTFSGHEQRNINWSQSRGRWNVASGIKTKADMDTFIAFFRARQGRAVGFRFKDWTDFQVTAGNIGTGDGSTTVFQLRKQYISGGVTINREIKKPVDGSVTIYIGGVSQPSGWSIDYQTGVLTFGSAVANLADVTADFEFDVPVRFDTDMMEVVANTSSLHNWGNIPLIEVRV